MKRNGSPVFKSLKSTGPNFDNERTRISNDSIKNIQSLNGNANLTSSENGTSQDSHLTTQNTPSFRTRFENRLLEDPLPCTSDHLQKNQNEVKFSQNNSFTFEMGPFFGLPTKVQLLIYQYKRIKELYEWQEHCLKEALGQQNLLIALPTSSGKTLVAEILMLRSLLLHQKNCIFILPYVSLVQEKVRDLCPIAVDLSFVVDEYAASKGTYPPKKRKKRNAIFVATIEKANGLLESLIETDRLSEVGLVVVDEVHMISERSGRGAKLESVISKLKYFAANIQLVSMSATVGNLDELAQFLDAKLFKGGFRPVPLTQYLKVDSFIAVVNSNAKTDEDLLEEAQVPSFPLSKETSKIDQDMIAPLVSEIVPTHSCLIFCPTKNNTQAVAQMLCLCMPKMLLQHHTSAKMSLLAALKEEGNGNICSILRKTIPFGLAYHHSGLSEGEKKLLEEAYLMGTLCCITCTSTLAAGINLPARRVIIRAPYIGKDFISLSRYQQMIGRAGRAGLDTVGESFLIASPKDLPKVKELLTSPVEKCESRLMEEEAKGLTDLVFSMVGLGSLKTPLDITNFVNITLWALQTKNASVIQEEVMSVLERLRLQGLLRLDKPQQGIKRKSQEGMITGSSSLADKEEKTLQMNDSLITCRVGKAAIKGSVDLKWANRLYSDLMVSRSSLAVHSHLHLLYLVTPYTSTDRISCNTEIFVHCYSRLNPEEREIAYLLGITEPRAISIQKGMKPKGLDPLVLERFYVALMLHQLLRGQDMWRTSEEFSIHRGQIQQLLHATVSFAHSAFYFCQELEELWAFKDLLSSFTKKLSICSCSEVTTLLALPTVKVGRAKLLYKAGFKSLADIAKANPQQLVTEIELLSYKVARQIISSAKMLLFEKATTLQEEAEDMLTGLLPS